jgi:hypothetical protein
MYSSRMGYLSPSLSPSCAASASFPATPLRGLGLSSCHFLPNAKEASLKPLSYLDSSTRRYWLESQAGQDHTCSSTQQNLSGSNPAAINPTSTTTNSRSAVQVQRVLTAAAVPLTHASCLDYPCPSALNPFSPCPYRTASALEYQSPSYTTTDSATADFQYPWYDLEAQDGYPTLKPSSLYSTPLKLESPTISHTIFTGSTPESPTFAANLQSGARADNSISFDSAADIMQTQHRAKSHRAFSWPRDSSYLEKSQETDACMTTQRSGTHHSSSRRSYRPRSKTSRVARNWEDRTTGASVRVTCSYGNGCGQTFNRKTDLDRHVNTVRRTKHDFQTFTDISQVHLRMRDKVCPFCGYGFGRGDILTR